MGNVALKIHLSSCLLRILFYIDECCVFANSKKNSIISLFGTLYQIRSVSRLNYFVEQSENRTQALNEGRKVMVVKATFSNI